LSADLKGTTPDTLIRFDNVTKRFGDNTVLDDLCFSVRPGKHVTLIGPSGSGKTTILRLLMTLETPDEGTIQVNGNRLFPAPEKERREARKKIGMVFQQFNLFPNMSVLRNLTEAPVRRRTPRTPRTRQRCAPRSSSSWWGWPTAATRSRRSSPAASSSGWRSPVRWPCGRRCCCSTR
jgi:ABC-type Fe3+/spermidine/putrescine transport system ATPase subunit